MVSEQMGMFVFDSDNFIGGDVIVVVVVESVYDGSGDQGDEVDDGRQVYVLDQSEVDGEVDGGENEVGIGVFWYVNGDEVIGWVFEVVLFYVVLGILFMYDWCEGKVVVWWW